MRLTAGISVAAAALIGIFITLFFIYASVETPSTPEPTRHPFAVGSERGGGAPASSGAPGFWRDTIAYVQAQQEAFYKELSAALKELRDSGSFAAAGGLMLASFLYGVFHAAGPGHGKAVVSAYVLTNRKAMKRGLQIAAAGAFLQAVTAIVLVYGTLLLVAGTGQFITQSAIYLEAVSYLMVLAVGLYLIWSGVSRLLGWPGARHTHAHHHGHGHDDGCDDHAHIPDAQAAATASWREAAGMALAIGLRPCSGAILVLVFAYGVGLHAAGIASAFAMAVGTGITVAALVGGVQLVRSLAERLADERASYFATVINGVRVAGGVVIGVVGLVLLAGALGRL